MTTNSSLDLKLREIRELEAKHTNHQKMMYGRNSAQKRKERIRKVILDYCQDLDVLDIGCAEGEYCEYFMEAEAKSFLGMDLSPTKIERAKKKYQGHPKCAFEAGGTEELKASQRMFDFILCTEVLQHIPDYLGFIRSLSDRLNVGGYFLYTVPYFSIGANHQKTNFNENESSEDLLKVIGGAGLGRTAGIWKYNVHKLNEEIEKDTQMKMEAAINLKLHVTNSLSLVLLQMSRKLFKTDMVNPYPVILLKK